MWFTLMDAGDARTCFKPEREQNVGRFFWWSGAAGPQPELSVACLCCFTAFLHKGEEACFLISWDLVLGDGACGISLGSIDGVLLGLLNTCLTEFHLDL